MRDLIFVSLEDWDDIWRRNQFVCEQLATRHPAARILFVGVPRNVALHLRRLDLRPLFTPGEKAPAGLENIILTIPWQLLPNRYGWSRRFNEWLLRRHVRRAARRLKFSRPILWLNPPDAGHLVGCLGESAVIYDITDDWTLLDEADAKKQLLTQQDAELCRRATAVIVCSPALLASRRALAKSIRLVANGVDVSHYAGVAGGKTSVPDAAGWPRPVLAYTGTLHGGRIDVELVRALAGTPGIGSVVMIGPDHLSGAERARLALPNIFLVGPVPYGRLPDYMRAADAFIVPHRITAFTESLNPIKLWEYLAAGKPIIATPVAGFRDYPHFVYFAESAPGFAAALERALSEDPAKPAQRKAEAAKHSWGARVDEIETLLSECIPAGV